MPPAPEAYQPHLDDRALIDAWRNGDTGAAGMLVERHQQELLRIAFLITGRADMAPELATAAVVETFSAYVTSSTDAEPSAALVATLVRLALNPTENPATEAPNNAPTGAYRPAEERFQVENERTRVRAALSRLEPPARAAIVMTEFARLPADLTSEVSGLAVAEIEAARERLRFAAGLDAAGALHGALAALALEAPRADLREGIEDALRARRQSARRRERLINAGAAGLTILVATALVWFLLGLDSPTRGETVDDSENLARNPTAERATGDGPGTTGLAHSPPSPTPLPTPPADVPNILLVRAMGGGEAGTILHRFSAGPQQVLSIQGSDNFVEAAAPIVSPDGEQIIMLWHQYVDGRVRGVVTAHDDALQHIEWVAEVASIPHEGGEVDGEKPPVFLTGAVDDERVYVSIHNWRSSDPVTIVVLSRESGELEGQIDTAVYGYNLYDIRLVASQHRDTVYLYAIGQDGPTQFGGLQIIFLAYRFPGGERVHAKTLADRINSRAFFLYGSRPTPDGNFLYDVEYTNATRELAVHFLNLIDGRLEPRLLLPFEPVADPLPYQQATSHDGRWLYVLSPVSRQIAVVDLASRALVGVVPLDMGEEHAGVTVATNYFPDEWMQLAPDGRTIFALGAGLAPGAPPSGIWVIDVPTWSLREILLPGTPVSRIVSGGSQELYVALPPGVTINQSTRSSSSVRLVPFEAVSAPGPDALATIATLYRDAYGRSPSVEGQPLGIAADFLPLAAMSVIVGAPEIEVGERVEIDVRFVNPLTGVPVYEGPDEASARYVPPDSVRAVLVNGGREVLVELGPAGHGWYRGSVILNEVGDWQLSVVARWSGALNDERRFTLRESIHVRGGLISLISGSALGLRAS